MTEVAVTEIMRPREVVPGVQWLGGCHEVKVLEGQPPVGHTHTAAYLLLGAEQTLLVDTGHPEKWRQTRADLVQLLGGRPLDYIFPTHTETPHSGNMGKLLTMYPGARIVGDSRDWDLFFPELTAGRLIDLRAGEGVDLGGGQRLVFIDALIKDLPTTQWAYDSKNRILFVADGFSYTHNAPLFEDEIPIHQSGQCSLFLSEWGHDPMPEQIEGVMMRALYTMRFIKLDELVIDKLPEFFRRWPTDIIAPAHGCVIDDVARMLPIAKQAHRYAYEHRPKPSG